MGNRRPRVRGGERGSVDVQQVPDQDVSVFAGVQCEVQLVESDGGFVQPGGH